MLTLEPRKTLVEQTYDALVDAICIGALAPGERLTEDALAARLNGPVDLLDMTLLHPVLSERLWRDVLAHLGVYGTPRDGIRIQDAAALRQAALAGLGVTTFAFLGVNMFLSGLHSYGTL